MKRAFLAFALGILVAGGVLAQSMPTAAISGTPTRNAMRLNSTNAAILTTPRGNSPPAGSRGAAKATSCSSNTRRASRAHTGRPRRTAPRHASVTRRRLHSRPRSLP